MRHPLSLFLFFSFPWAPKLGVDGFVFFFFFFTWIYSFTIEVRLLGNALLPFSPFFLSPPYFWVRSFYERWTGTFLFSSPLHRLFPPSTPKNSGRRCRPFPSSFLSRNGRRSGIPLLHSFCLLSPPFKVVARITPPPPPSLPIERPWNQGPFLFSVVVFSPLTERKSKDRAVVLLSLP